MKDRQKQTSEFIICDLNMPSLKTNFAHFNDKTDCDNATTNGNLINIMEPQSRNDDSDLNQDLNGEPAKKRIKICNPLELDKSVGINYNNNEIEKDSETAKSESKDQVAKAGKSYIEALNLKPFKKNLQSPKKSHKFGNYDGYYGKRYQEDSEDLRLTEFAKQKNLFENKDVLDIGCNCGAVTTKIAKDNERFNVKSIVGIDIDKSFINRARKFIEKSKIKTDAEHCDRLQFPFNIKFVHGNYVLKDDVLLEIEREQFDVILCLSVTKWIQLNFGDEGLMQAFRRMFLQLRSGGCLILEPQPWKSYKKRKNLTPEIAKNYDKIAFRPERFTEFLLGPNVGFSEMKRLTTPEHKYNGFKRPLQIFYKK